MNYDEDKINRLIEESDNVKLKEDTWWFSRQEQNKLVFNIAAQRAANGYDDAEQNVKVAQETVDTFYQLVLKPTTRR